jgi:di/tricarboxylate transporter
MSMELALVLGLLAIVVAMFALDRPRMDAVALLAMCVLPFTGVIEVAEAIAGFSDPNIVLIASLFVLGEGLVRTGVARNLGDWLISQAGEKPNRLIALLMLSVGSLGAVMSSTAITAIFIPVALRIGRRTGLAPSQLMMPLSVSGLISGMMTLVATAPNLVVNSELIRRGEAGFHFFSFTPFGIPILVLGIFYMMIARRWLPAANHVQPGEKQKRPKLADWIERYKLTEREHWLRVMDESAMVGQTLGSMGLRGNEGASVVAIQRSGLLMQPTTKTELLAGDILFVDLVSPEVQVETLCEKFKLEVLPLKKAPVIRGSQEIGMAEMIVPADSDLVGKTIAQAGIRSFFGFSVIGLRRGLQALQVGLMEEQLRIGDTLLVIGPWKAIRNVQTAPSRDLLPLSLPAEMDDISPVTGKSMHAVVILLAVVGVMISGVVPNVQVALLGCLALGACGCIDFDSAYRAIDWKTIVLIVGMLPFSLALERTGGVGLASDGLVWLTSNMGIYGVLGALFLSTAVLGMFISNTATAVLMAPVAMTIAEHLDKSPYPFAMIVALAASTAFMTPVSSPVNTLVVTPGGYRFSDFVKVGVPFTLLVMVICVLLVPVLLVP